MIYDNRTFRNAKGPVSGRFGHSSSRSIIPRVTLSSFGRSKFTWCLQEAWGDAEYDSYLALSQNQGWNPFKRIGYANENMRNMAQPVGKWLLKDDLGALLGAAEVQVTSTGFSRIKVNLALGKDTATWERSGEAFSYLVSALFLITSCDLLECIVEGGDASTMLGQLNNAGEAKQETANEFGRNRAILAPRIETFICDDDWSVPLKPMKIWEISQHDWWTFDSAKKDADDLKYIQKRIENDQLRQDFLTKRRRRSLGFFSRFFIR
jgi:hypothetical protein